MTGKSGIVQTFSNAVPGPEPSPDAIERLYRVGRQHQLGRSHDSVTGSGLALSRRSLSESGQTPCLGALMPATSVRANDGSRLDTPQGPKAARRKQPALRVPGSSLARPRRGAGAPPASGSPAPRRRDRESPWSATGTVCVASSAIPPADTASCNRWGAEETRTWNRPQDDL